MPMIAPRTSGQLNQARTYHRLRAGRTLIRCPSNRWIAIADPPEYVPLLMSQLPLHRPGVARLDVRHISQQARLRGQDQLVIGAKDAAFRAGAALTISH